MRRTNRHLAASVPVRVASWVLLALGALGVAAAALIGRPAHAQNEADVVLSAPELEELVGPIALYPDDLVAIVLPASTYPLQIVEAARFLEDRKATPSLTPDDDWDDSVVALLNYPEVVTLLNGDLDWTWDLGTAVLNQNAEVLDAIQDFRERAYSAGNLRSDDRQTVTADSGAIAIAPADPEVIYVPYYEPQRVVVYQSAPVYHYYPWGYPVYYYPYPVGYSFRTGFFWGVTTAFSIGWHTHNLHVYHYGHHHHPYRGWRYYDPFYTRNVFINVNIDRDDVWRPRHRYGNRPVVRGTEGRVYNSGDARRAGRNGGSAGATYRSRSSADRAPVADSRASENRGVTRSTATRDRSTATGTTRAGTVARGTAGDSGRPTRATTDATRDYRPGRSTGAPREIERAAPDNSAARGEARRAMPLDRGQRATGATTPRTLGRVVPTPSEAPRSAPPRATAVAPSRPAARDVRESSRAATRDVRAPSRPTPTRDVVRAPSRPQAGAAPRNDSGGGNYRNSGNAGSRGGGSVSRGSQSRGGGDNRSNGR